MPLSQDQIRDLYRRRARHYDRSAVLFNLFGFREATYRQEAVEALRLLPGDTVVELGCGTGLNFAALHRAVGPSGRIIGVDLTDRMLDVARERVRDQGWSNVELVCADAAGYTYPAPLDGVLSTYAITLLPEVDEVVRRGAKALSPGGRFTVLDFKKPERTPAWLLRFMLLVTRPFGVTLDLAERHPWTSIESHLAEAEMQERFLGFVYIATGTAHHETPRTNDPSPEAR